jgi:hypothetical protein
MKIYTPYIDIEEDKVYITGSKESLTALGSLLITKGKLGSSMSAIFYDGRNKPIYIECSDDNFVEI